MNNDELKQCGFTQTYYAKVAKSKKEREQEVENLHDRIVNELGQTPAGVDKETTILAKQKNEGIWIAEENGYYYFWNGTGYQKGYAYQGLALPNSLVNELENIENAFPNAIKNETKTLNIEFTQGALSNSTGEFSPNNNRISSNPIYINKNISIRMKENATTTYWIRAYSETGFLTNVFVNSLGNIETGDATPAGKYELYVDDIIKKVPTLSYIRLVEKNDDGSVIKPNESQIVISTKIVNGKLDDVYQKKNVDNKLVIRLERGGLQNDNGLLIDGGSIDYALQLARTPLFIETYPSTNVTFNYNEKEMTIFEYDKDFNFIKNSKSKTNIITSSTTKYLKLTYVDNSKPFIELDKLNDLEIDGLREVKNSDSDLYKVVSNDVTYKRIAFHYEIPSKDSTPTINRGMLKLPKNYSPIGKKIPLIIFVHGSNAFGNINIPTMSPDYDEYINYLRDNGYAIFDCYGWGSKIKSGVNPWNTPTGINCFKCGVEWVLSRFNIDENNIFVTAKSLGGLTALGFEFNYPFKPQAIGLLAPETTMLNLPFGYGKSQKQLVIEDLGLATPPESLLDNTIDKTSEEYKNYMRDNFNKYSGYEPFMNNLSGGTVQEKKELTTESYTIYTGNIKDKWSKYYPIPLKIWGVKDDAAIPYKKLVNFITICQNGGSRAELRTFEAGLGGHHAVDTDPNAPKVDSITTRLGITYTNVPLAYVELMQYFESFRTE